ncbi:hypothetical protein CCAX7_46640 [Capsulimonas corticalis]|uniref:Uncharacterized protein n=1 Tax=Capsulimonas corticalis TaxID=2219043 RepID=A0A402CQH1_9BACT|nr:hypothetical protein [Capsulimonas corticalis]BDI32613.1 hypothetical protein CCAX7_46640 [Capsulimonas corticalis]
MKIKQVRTFRQQPLIALVAVAAFALSPVPVSAREDVTPPLDVQVSLVTPAQITLGEPILLRYKIVNGSEQKVAAQLGVQGMDWYTITLRDANNTVMPSTQNQRPVQPRGAFSIENGSLDKGGYSDGYIPVTKRVVIQHPGKYTLTLHVNIPYTLGSDTVAGSPDIISQDMAFQILVTAPDSHSLQSTAEALREAVSDTGTNGKLLRADMDALFSMPEAQVSAVWKDLATKPSMNNDLVASELEALGSKTSVDILVNMLDVPTLKCTPVSDRINRIYNAGDPILREHIKAVARQKGFEMPECAGESIIID